MQYKIYALFYKKLPEMCDPGISKSESYLFRSGSTTGGGFLKFLWV